MEAIGRITGPGQHLVERLPVADGSQPVTAARIARRVVTEPVPGSAVPAFRSPWPFLGPPFGPLTVLVPPIQGAAEGPATTAGRFTMPAVTRRIPDSRKAVLAMPGLPPGFMAPHKLKADNLVETAVTRPATRREATTAVRPTRIQAAPPVTSAAGQPPWIEGAIAEHR